MKAVVHDFPPHWLAERKKFGAHRFDEFWDGVLHIPPVYTTDRQGFLCDLAVFLWQRWARPRGCHADRGVNVTTPKDEPNWLHNFRIADITLLMPDRFHIERGDYMVGPPSVVVAIRTPGDETDAKFPFWSDLGVPELWVFDRDTKEPEVYELAGSEYRLRAMDADGWLRSPASGVEFRWEKPGAVTVRVAGDDATAGAEAMRA